MVSKVSPDSPRIEGPRDTTHILLEDEGLESPSSEPVRGVVKDQGLESPGLELARSEIPHLDRGKGVAMDELVKRHVFPHLLHPFAPRPLSLTVLQRASIFVRF